MDSSRHHPLEPLLLAGGLIAAHVGLLWLGDLAERPDLTIALLGTGFVCLGVFALRHGSHLRPIPLLLVAILLRGLLLPLDPTLSDDVLRYVWDGRVTTAGFDPYQLAPESEELAALRDDRWEAMPHKHVATVYPPLALAVFAGASGTADPILGLKIILAAADVAACLLMIVLAQRRNLPLGRVALYAWNPLATLEIAGMGHVDALVVLSQVAAVLLLTQKRPLRAGIAAAAGVLAKLTPLFALPFWFRTSRPRRPFALGALLPLLLGAAWVLGWPPRAPSGLVAYGVSWQFNGPAFEPLQRGLAELDVVPAIKSALDVAKEKTGHHDLLNRLYPFVYPEMLAKLLLGAVFLVVLGWTSWRARDLIGGTGRILGALILCSATVYPWYLLWVLPWAALANHRAWLIASATVCLAYLPQHSRLELWPWLFAAIWVPVAVTMPWSRWSSD